MRKQDISGTWYSGIPSWAELKKMAQSGTISQVLSEGDLIPIRLANGEENAIRVTHDQAGNMFFVFKDCLRTAAPMNDYNSSKNSSWATCELQKYLQEQIIFLLPDDMHETIKTIPIKQDIENGIRLSYNELFLLSEEQVFGECRLSHSEEGVSQLECFKGSRTKVRDGNPTWWWLRSPYSCNADCFVIVDSGGAVNYNYADTAGGIAPAFCLIEPKKI